MTRPRPEPLRLVPREQSAPEAEKPQCCHVHDFAIAELVISKAGKVVRRLRPVPGGFVEIPL